MALRKKLSGYKFLAVILVGLSITGYYLFPKSNWPVILPLLVALIIAVVFIILLLKRSDDIPLDEIGIWYIAVVLLYTIYPLFIYLFGPRFNDWRLCLLYQPTPKEVGHLAWYYVVYLFSFSLVYLRARKIRLPERRLYKSPDRVEAFIALFLLILFNVILFLVGKLYGLSVLDYRTSYSVYYKLPLLVRQVITKFPGMQFILELLLLAYLYSNFKRWRIWIFGWMGFKILAQFSQQMGIGGSRMWLILFLAANIFFFHIRVRRLTIRFFTMAGILIIGFFLFLGFIRGAKAESPSGKFNLLEKNTEFESLYGNAYDINERRKSGEIKRASIELYFADLFALFPQQLLPFKKIDLSEWYIETCWPEIKGTGAGLVFGVITQSVLGLGLLEAILRGMLVGYLFGKLVRFYRHYSLHVWVVIFYVFMICISFWTFRNSTFFPLVLIEYEFLPVVLILPFTAWFLRSTLAENPET